jgi:hypothetical protein
VKWHELDWICILTLIVFVLDEHRCI